jgi:drug/metabolite transporter (DMT)-like permease
MRSVRLGANLLLLMAAVIWGGGFVAQRLGMQHLGPFIFNGFRFLLGGVSLIPIMLLRPKQTLPRAQNLGQILAIGSIAGTLLFFGATFQQLGLVYTTAGKAGFITGLYVIIVPLLGMFWGDRTPWLTWAGALLAVLGLYLLSASGGMVLSPGDGYVLLGAFFWAGHVQFIARYSPQVDAIELSFVQAVFTSLISFGVGLLREEFILGQVMSAALPILYGGVISIGIAYTLQVVAQRKARPAHAALILSLESVFAVLWGWLFLDETLTPKILLGCSLMLAGMLVSQLQNKESYPADSAAG